MSDVKDLMTPALTEEKQKALDDAKKAGVDVLFFKCHVEPDLLEIER